MVILGYEFNSKFNTVRKSFIKVRKMNVFFSLNMCSDYDLTRKIENLRKIGIKLSLIIMIKKPNKPEKEKVSYL
jgi:hypothetical protein